MAAAVRSARRRPPRSAPGAAAPACASHHARHPPRSTEYQAALKAVGNQGVHFVSTADQSGVTLDASLHPGTTSGQQVLVVKKQNPTERMTARVVGSNGYANGNQAALQNVIGLTAAPIEEVRRDRGCRSRPRTRASNEPVGGLLSSQVSKEIEIGGPDTYGTGATAGGQHALAILGSVSTQSGSKVPVVLYVPSSGKPLPIEEITNAGTAGGGPVGHPRAPDALAMGREQEPDGADPHGVAAASPTPPPPRRPPPGRSAPWRHCSKPCRATSRPSGAPPRVNAANRRSAGAVSTAPSTVPPEAELDAACPPRGMRAWRRQATDGFHLAARWIIHTVGPAWREAPGRARFLASCYRRPGRGRRARRSLDGVPGHIHRGLRVSLGAGRRGGRLRRPRWARTSMLLSSASWPSTA